jgi:hypothetical protein
MAPPRHRPWHSPATERRAAPARPDPACVLSRKFGAGIGGSSRSPARRRSAPRTGFPRPGRQRRWREAGPPRPVVHFRLGTPGRWRRFHATEIISPAGGLRLGGDHKHVRHPDPRLRPPDPRHRGDGAPRHRTPPDRRAGRAGPDPQRGRATGQRDGLGTRRRRRTGGAVEAGRRAQRACPPALLQGHARGPHHHGRLGSASQITIDRWARLGRGTYGLHPFTAEIHREATFGGYTVPSQLTAGYPSHTEPWPGSAFIRTTIDDAIFH